MPVEIVNGGGTGLRASVTEDSGKGRLDVSSRMAERIYYSNRSGLSYAVRASVTPAAANDVFFYMKNISTNTDLVIDWYRLYCGTNEGFDFFVNQDGEPGGSPTVLIPVNLNLSSGNSALGIFYEDSDITGLNVGNHIDRVHALANVDSVGRIPGGIRLTQNTIFTIQALTGGLPVEATIGFHFE
ncbi:MAG: hypothetical protein V3W20_10910 [Candidatus Neomarinimicrobiota bacterium]